MTIQPAGQVSNLVLPTRAAPANGPTLSDVPLPSDRALLSGAPPPETQTPRPPTLEPQAAAPQASPPPPTTLALIQSDEPAWKGELLELKGRMDFLYGLQTNQCGQWWHGTIKNLPGPGQELAQELANNVLTEAQMQDPDATIAHVAAPVGVGVNALMLAGLQTENDVRLDPQLDRTERLKHNLFVTAITGEMVGRLSPEDVSAAEHEAAGNADAFAEALAGRLSPEDIQASQQGAAEGPLFRLSLHPGLPAFAEGLSQDWGHYQNAIGETRTYLNGLSEVQARQTAVANEVGQFFQNHPEALQG